MFLAVDLHLQNRGSVNRMEKITLVGAAEANSVFYFFEENTILVEHFLNSSILVSALVIAECDVNV